MNTIKQNMIQDYLEGHAALDQRTAEQELADQEWKKKIAAMPMPDEHIQEEVDEAAYALAGEYEYVGMNAGFDLACRMFAEIFSAALKGGASA